MIYAATEGPCTLIIERDDDPVDPRIDCDPFGHMICWHRRYSLGDGHHYDTPEDFLRDLYRKSIRDDGKRLVSFLKSGDARGARSALKAKWKPMMLTFAEAVGVIGPTCMARRWIRAGASLETSTM